MRVNNFNHPFFYLLTATSTLLVLGWLLVCSRYGIDFTDESSYLVWIATPFSYTASVSQFGFVYHVLFDLLEYNVVSLRQANLIVTFTLTWLFVNVLFSDVFEAPKEIESKLKRSVIAASFATTSLIYLYSIPTPSYNTLTFHAFLITASGMLLAKRASLSASKIGYIFIGIGGWLAFMAKPTSAASLAMLTLVYLLTLRKNIHYLVISLIVTSALLVFSAFMIDGSTISFLRRLQEGYSTVEILKASHSASAIFRWDDYVFTPTAKYFCFYSVIALSFVIFLTQSRLVKLSVIGNLLFIIFFWALIISTAGYIFDVMPPEVSSWLTDKLLIWKFQALMIWVIPFAALLTGFLLSWDNLDFQLHNLCQALCFFLLPHAYAFGTNNNYWAAGSVAAIFWIAAGFSVLRTCRIKQAHGFLILLGLSSQLFSVALIKDGHLSPYRQPEGLTKNNVSTVFGYPGSLMILSDNYARYLSNATNAAKVTGFKRGTPMIDLTGQSPGILYAIGAFSIGRAWTIGGYPGSDTLIEHLLRKSSCNDLSIAWVLNEPYGPRKISNTVLRDFGADLNLDYQLVAEFETSEYAGGYKTPRLQQMLKPIRSIETASAACEIARQSMNSEIEH